MLSVLRHRDYRLLWMGQAISFLGDQFHLVALPWLVLTITQDPLHIGLVLACSSIPRAAFMLVGGVWADRHSPRDIVLVSDVVRFCLTALLATSILLGQIDLWVIYAAAIVFGTVSGFFYPAANAMIPRILDDSHLESGNSLFQIADEAAGFLGPAAAGLLIALFGRSVIGGEEVASLYGIGTAYLVDMVTFAFSAICLTLTRRLPAALADTDVKRTLHSIREGLGWLWHEPEIRWMLTIIALGNAFVSGPLLVGLPVLADSRLAQGPAAFGIILSVFAGGNLAGMLAAGAVPRLTGRAFVAAVVALFTGFGIAIGALAFVTSTWQALPLMALVGMANGYMAITLITQLQRVTPPAMLGRMMGLYMFSIYGLMPVSQILAGVVIKAGLAVMFMGAGACLLLVALLALTRPEIHTLTARLDVGESEA